MATRPFSPTCVPPAALAHGVSNVVVDTDVVLVILTMKSGAPQRDDEGVVHAGIPRPSLKADRGAEQGHAAALTAA
jgi:hypothetical protein